MKNILLGVTGGIAAYKAADIARMLTKDGFNVEVIMTRGSMEFVTPLTFQALTQNRVYTDMFEEYRTEKSCTNQIKHISLAQKANLLLIAPATANVMGKLASGIADDMLTTVVMACRGIPLLVAPAMNTNMYENPAVQSNLLKLKEYGYEIIEPRSARLACGTIGKGALADVDTIVNTVESRIKDEIQ
jgi:phosphopantothenoylcysteine decarboxylase